MITVSMTFITVTSDDNFSGIYARTLFFSPNGVNVLLVQIGNAVQINSSKFAVSNEGLFLGPFVLHYLDSCCLAAACLSHE